ncbi:MAG: NAD-dependent epimerase/dehydratase family protein [Candidatus Aminicenantes bacterium]|nr:NAD-dependent epimerase/dehydratase family protein [Candidatus Aminicenantes bacterium]
MPPKPIKILVTGAGGQIGTELVRALRQRHGRDNVTATDVVEPSPQAMAEGPFALLDVTRRADVAAAVESRRIDVVYHLAAILSARGEKNPGLAWEVNINGTFNVLEVAREKGLARVFCPSSIAVFGPETPKENTPQETVLRPKTMYGLTKVAGELLGDYYVQKHGLDVRGCRYPGIISHETLPGGGTTDYAVAIFFEAVKNGRYACFLRPETRLPMMYMPDCLKATLDLMEADFGRLKHHCDFNLASMSFSAEELAAEIRKHIPGLVVAYRPDFRQAIADSWPRTIDDAAAREEWGWKPAFDLASMTADMLRAVSDKKTRGLLP